MNTQETTVSEQHAAKRRWLNAHEEGYHKAMGNRQVQMIAIGGAIGTGLFWGQAHACKWPVRRWRWSIWSAGSSLSLFCGRWVNWFYTALPAAVSSHTPVNFGEKAAYVAGWMYFINWAMTGIVDITAVALYMHYWGAFGDVPQWVLRSARWPLLAP